MQLKEGTKIYDMRGEEMGSLDRVVIDPRSQNEIHLAVGDSQVDRTPDYHETR